MSCAGIPASDVQRANFHKQIKMMNLQYFCNFMYIWWLLKFWGWFFVAAPSLGHSFNKTAACSHYCPLMNPAPSLGHSFNKTAPCSHHCPLRHPARSLGHWYTGYTFGSSINKTSKIFQRANFHTKMKMMNLQYILHFCVYLMAS